jgi:O-acetyl-ADP-ribose deacetylase (regulator of RNase III)
VTVEVLDTDITQLEVDAIEDAARIEIDEVSRHLGAGGSAIERVVFAVRGDEARQVFERALAV